MKEKSSHWYHGTGQSCHSLPTVSKTAKSPTRGVRITDAVALGLFPSVTTILKILDKPALSDWKNEQVAGAALRMIREIITYEIGKPIPPQQQEKILMLNELNRDKDKLFIDQIIEEAFRQVEQAADAGTLIHDGCEKALQGLEYDEEAPVLLPELQQTFPLKTFVRPVQKFIYENEIVCTSHEIVTVNKAEGYAGKLDVAFSSKRGMGIGDFKTRKTRPGKPVFAYDEQPMQTAAYFASHYGPGAISGAPMSNLNLFISTTEPGRVEPVWHDAALTAREWDAFKLLCAYWRIRTGYDPRPKA